jgi:hypothetical protein
MNLLHIFRANKRAEESGVTFADVQEAVANYDPALHEAPIVIGHPKLDDPAYGWVDSLSLVSKTVLAAPKQVVQEFADWIDRGLYKKISASWYGKTNPDNPTPGKLYLKHVGYLGAVPPKIKGLPDSSFAESEGEVLTLEFSEIDFGDWGDNINVQLWRSMRDYLVDTAGSETAERVLPTQKIDWLLEAAMEPPPMPEKAYNNYSENPMPPTEQELEAREQAIALRERAALLKEQELQFSEALDIPIKEGRIPAAEKPSHLKRLKMLAAIPADSVVDFAEGKADYSPTAEYIAELKARSVVINFNEISGDELPPVTTDPKVNAKAIEKRVAEAKAEGRYLSFAEADAEIRSEQNGAKT